MEENKYPTLVVGKQNKEIYEFHGNDIFQNTKSGKAGKILPEDAKKWFFVPVVLNVMSAKNPNLLTLIKLFGMKYDGLISHGTEEELKEMIKTI